MACTAGRGRRCERHQRVGERLELAGETKCIDSAEHEHQGNLARSAFSHAPEGTSDGRNDQSVTRGTPDQNKV